MSKDLFNERNINESFGKEEDNDNDSFTLRGITLFQLPIIEVKEMIILI